MTRVAQLTLTEDEAEVVVLAMGLAGASMERDLERSTLFLMALKFGADQKVLQSLDDKINDLAEWRISEQETAQ